MSSVPAPAIQQLNLAANPVEPILTEIKIVFTYRTPTGEVQTFHEIDPSHEISSHNLHIEKKFEKKRDPETKDIVGFEDTGERNLSLKVKYHVK